jgi:predicted DNA-binding transcriptional regulator AlpA
MEPLARQKLKTRSAAKYCGSTASTFQKLRLTGAGPRYFKIGRRVVYDVADLESWLAEHRRQSTLGPLAECA